MKTNQKQDLLRGMNILLLMSFFAITLFAVSSCGKKSGPGTISDQAASDAPKSVSAVDSAYTDPDVLPVFTGGDTAILGYIKRNTIYPESAKNTNTQGKVIVRLVVRKDGSVSDVKVLKGVEASLDKEAIRVVSSLPKFEKPGIKNGEPVSVNYVIPIEFNLR